MAQQTQVEITPLGAAIVEAMPDRDRMKRIKRQFKTHKRCPASDVFDAEAVEAWYRERGQRIKAAPATAGESE